MRFLTSQIGKIGLVLALLLLCSACKGSEDGELSPAPAPTSSEALAPTTGPSTEPPVLPTAGSSTDPTRIPAEEYADLEMVTLLPRDAIPAIDNPQFLRAAEADTYYDPDELIIGVEFQGEARAYSVPFLSNHEIVNDSVGGVKIAVTW